MQVGTNVLLLWMPIHRQKINFMTPLIIETLPTYHFEALCGFQTMSYHIHLIFVHQYAASIDAYQQTKNHPLDETHLALVRGAYPLRRFTRVRQRNDKSILIRQDQKGLF